MLVPIFPLFISFPNFPVIHGAAVHGTAPFIRIFDPFLIAHFMTHALRSLYIVNSSSRGQTCLVVPLNNKGLNAAI